MQPVFISFLCFLLEANNKHTEKELLLKVASGDEQAFATLFHQYYPKLAGYVFNWTKSAATAAEIVQDVFLKIWINRSVLSEVESFDKYLYVVSRNYTYNELRRSARERMRFKTWLEQAEASTEEMSFPDLPVNYTPLIEAAVALLPAQQKRVYELKYQEHLKYDEIARLMNIAPETARKHMQAATRTIGNYVKEHLPVLLIISTVPHW